MSSLRRVRKNFRKEVLRLVESGEGSWDSLIRLADAYFGSNSIGYHAVVKAFLHGEVNNAVAKLRSEGFVETVGRHWKSTENLQDEDITQIQTRRLRRIRGELKSQIRLAKDRGRNDEAAIARAALGVMSSCCDDSEQEVSAVVQEAIA